MTKNLFSILAFISLVLLFASCTDEGCEEDCPEGAVQLIDCSCEILGNTDSSISVISNITSDETWTAGNEYLLEARITVESGATLTIEPGTVIKGGPGALVNATSLMVARGAKLIANGTETAPIIFTSSSDELTSNMVLAGNYTSPNLDNNVNGLWGGLIILGNAPISALNMADEDASEVQIEGIPTSDLNGLYGGNDPNDNSGSLSYISIRHGGTNIGNGNEINGLTLGGVGSGTVISGVEVVANQDDGIEFFGGNVSVDNVLVWNCGDDGLDSDQAWNGTCTNWIVALPNGGSALELDGPEGSFAQGCHTLDSGTIYAGSNIDHIIDCDDNTNVGITNLYVLGVDPTYDATIGIESYGGDGMCTTGTWQYTVPAGYDGATLFADPISAGEAAEIEANANTVGANSSVFGWTLGGSSGVLESLGL